MRGFSDPELSTCAAAEYIQLAKLDVCPKSIIGCFLFRISGEPGATKKDRQNGVKHNRGP